MENADTKDHIYSCLLELLETRSYDEIGVRDVVTLAKVSRQTFYYHFDNLFGIFEYALERERRSRKAVFLHDRPLDDLGEELVSLKNLRPLTDAVYRSRSSTKLRDHLFDKAYNIMMQAIGKAKKALDEEMAGLTAKSFAYAYSGLVIEWIADGMKDSVWRHVERIRAYADRGNASGERALVERG